MAARALVVIWTLASELSSPGTAALQSATHDALGPDVEVRAEATPEGDVVRAAEHDHATAIVQVTWDAEEHRRARLLCYLPALQRWVDRELSFASDDPEPERGRTLGLLVASIFLDAGVLQRLEERPAEPAPRREAPPLPVPRVSERAPQTALEASAQVAGPGTASGFGAWLGLERALGGPTAWAGVSGQARFGSIDEAQATSRLLAVGLHATWLAWFPSPRSWLGARAGLSGAQLSVTHLSAGDAGSQSQARFLGLFELTLHTGFHFTPSSALASDLGLEISSGTTEIYVEHELAASWPRAVPVLRVGVQTSF